MNAGGVAVAGTVESTSILAVAAENSAAAGPVALFTFTVTVYSNGGGNVGSGATVHLEPRQSGLPYDYNAVTVSGVATFNIAAGDAGYYDLEASQDGYEDGANLQEYVGNGGSKSVYLDPL